MQQETVISFHFPAIFTKNAATSSEYIFPTYYMLYGHTVQYALYVLYIFTYVLLATVVQKVCSLPLRRVHVLNTV
jgi:hypothetical protein